MLILLIKLKQLNQKKDGVQFYKKTVWLQNILCIIYKMHDSNICNIINCLQSKIKKLEKEVSKKNNIKKNRKENF